MTGIKQQFLERYYPIARQEVGDSSSFLKAYPRRPLWKVLIINRKQWYGRRLLNEAAMVQVLVPGMQDEGALVPSESSIPHMCAVSTTTIRCCFLDRLFRPPLPSRGAYRTAVVVVEIGWCASTARLRDSRPRSSQTGQVIQGLR